MNSKLLKTKQITAAAALLAAVLADVATPVQAAEDSVAARNIAAIYQVAGADLGATRVQSGQSADTVSLIDGNVREWRDPSSVDLGFEAADAEPAAERVSENVALENIRDIFNTHSDD